MPARLGSVNLKSAYIPYQSFVSHVAFSGQNFEVIRYFFILQPTGGSSFSGFYSVTSLTKSLDTDHPATDNTDL